MIVRMRAAMLQAGNTTLTLLPERAVWLEQARLLLVADLHLGKAVSFRKLGVPVPQGTTTANLDRLTAIVRQHQAQGIVFLGDFLHSAHAHAEATMQALARWRQAHPQLSLTLVRGNHDDHAGDPPPWFDVRCVDEPWTVFNTALALCHHPQMIEGAYVVAGHSHPSVVVAEGFERLRLPCFHATKTGLVVPAFGEFTGTHPIKRCAGDVVYAVVDGRLVAVP